MIPHTERCCNKVFPPGLHMQLPHSLEQCSMQKTSASTTAFGMNRLPVSAEADRRNSRGCKGPLKINEPNPPAKAAIH